jgi:hypothetical protein
VADNLLMDQTHTLPCLPPPPHVVSAWTATPVALQVMPLRDGVNIMSCSCSSKSCLPCTFFPCALMCLNNTLALAHLMNRVPRKLAHQVRKSSLETCRADKQTMSRDHTHSVSPDHALR